MKENKTTFGPAEKEILEILTAFERELEEKLQESKGEIERVKYYEKFFINGIDFQNMFITTEKDVDGNITYHLYCGGVSKEVISIDSEGNVIIKNPELERYFAGMEFDLEKIMEENEQEPKKLKGVSEKTNPAVMTKALKENQQQDGDEEQDDFEQIQNDLAEQGDDLKINQYRKIKEPYIHERMPEVFKKGEENGIAFSNKLNRFVIISKVDGHYQLNKNVETSKTTLRTIISIDEKGQRMERNVPYALMRVSSNTNKEIAVTIGQYGIPEIDTVDVTPNQERIARPVREQGEGLDKEEHYAVRTEFKQEGKMYPDDIGDAVKDMEEREGDDVDYDRTEDDVIPGTDKTWGQLMKETGESLPRLIERYNREINDNGHDSKEAVDIMEEDFGRVNHDHKQ